MLVHGGLSRRARPCRRCSATFACVARRFVTCSCLTKRPGFIRLMNALKPRPPFQVLVMPEESRLGREAIETAYALKQLVTAGVRVFFYLEDRERTLNSPIEKAMLSLQTMGDEMEREKARLRVTDAMLRKARAG